MKHREPPRVAYIAALIACRVPGMLPYRAARIADDLTRISHSLSRCYENACNGWPNNQAAWNKIGAPRNAKRIERLRAKAAAFLSELPGCSMEHNSDPRGAAITLHSWGDNKDHPIY